MLGLMTEATPQKNAPRNIADFVDGYDPAKGLDLEVAINEKGGVTVFHSHPFTGDISWFEFDLRTNKLDFVLDDGDVRDIGLPLSQGVAKHMQNAHQILMVLMDPKTGDAKAGVYVPLVIHRS
jgi:hypothetical protein